MLRRSMNALAKKHPHARGEDPTRVHPTYTGIGKHPHARGEDDAPVFADLIQIETPPRTWGRLAYLVAYRWARRNTPTHVGKTLGIY